jgi:DHA2 family multidrug resistance protein-like MFS transporter
MNARTSRERAAIATVLSAMALVVLDAGIVNVALPTIGRTFAQTPARSLLVVTVYQLALVIGLLPCAHAADRIGYRRLFLSGLIVFSSSSLLCALAPTLPLLVAARFFQGLGGAAVMALGIALLRFALGRDRLGFAIAWNALVVAICSALAPAIGALILSFASWRWLFVSTLPMAAIALIASPSLPAVKTDGGPTDLLGISLYASAASCVIMAAELARSTPLIAFGIAVAAILCGYLLFRRDRNKPAPLVPLDLLAMRPFRNSVVASIFFFTGQSAGLLGLTFYLQLSLGRSAATAGLVIVAWPAGVAVTSRLAGWLADRFETGWICATGGIVLATGMAGAALWPIGQTVAPLTVCALICGVGFGLFQVPNNRTMFLTAPANRSAAAGGLQGTARLTGQTAGALLVTFVVSAAPLPIAPRVAMGLAGLSALIAAWASRLRSVSTAGAADVAQHLPLSGSRPAEVSQ